MAAIRGATPTERGLDGAAASVWTLPLSGLRIDSESS